MTKLPLQVPVTVSVVPGDALLIASWRLPDAQFTAVAALAVAGESPMSAVPPASARAAALSREAPLSTLRCFAGCFAIASPSLPQPSSPSSISRLQ
jgi:hypothetical protein